MGLFDKTKLKKIREREQKRKRYTIMLVDDEQANLDTLTSMFNDHYNIIRANDGDEALDMVRQPDLETISLIISDQRMPNMTGVDFFKHLIHIMPKTKRIILTGYTDVQDIVSSINEAHIYKFVLKPFDRDDLMLTVARALENYELEEQLDEYNRNLEIKVRERTAQLEAKNQEILRTQEELMLQKRLAYLGTVTSGIAHEMRNPLNFIKNFAEVSIEMASEFREIMEPVWPKLDEDTSDSLISLSENIEKNANLIHRYGQRANAIIENMMYMMQSTQSRREWIDFNHLVDDCSNLELRSVANPGEAKDVRVVKFFSEEVSMVEILPQRLSQALFNIVTNALEAMGEKQSLKGNNYYPTIWVDTSLEDECAIVTFKDNGIGITEQQREEIFHPFYTTKSPNRGNVGLGLSIAYDTIVEEHKGSIRVNSVEGDFTEFIIRIPVRTPH